MAQFIFSSVSATPAFYAQFAGNPGNEGTGLLTQLLTLQATDQRNSLLRAHGAYVVQLMYSGGQGIAALDRSQSASFIHHKVTAFEATTVLQSGVVDPIHPAVLLRIWVARPMVLGLLYGHRRR